MCHACMSACERARDRARQHEMIGVRKNIIAVAAGPFQFAMINPVITKKSVAYQTGEGCLSLDGVRSCTRYEEIEVDYLDQNVKNTAEDAYTG